jgi:hypothetical protein
MKETSEKYEDAAEWAWSNYSRTIFPTEMDFLIHLFFVDGNGYKWENGALVQVMYEKPTRDTPWISFDEWKQYSCERKEIYTLWSKSKCVTFPDDIRPDWLEKLFRVLMWTITERPESYIKNQQWIDLAIEKIGRLAK